MEKSLIEERSHESKIEVADRKKKSLSLPSHRKSEGYTFQKQLKKMEGKFFYGGENLPAASPGPSHWYMLLVFGYLSVRKNKTQTAATNIRKNKCII